MHEKIEEVLGLITNKDIRLLVKGVVEYNPYFLECPGGCSRHHAYKGGLLDHSHSTAILARKIAEHYTHLNPNLDIVTAGAFLHDIGKTECYMFEDYVESKDVVTSNGILTSQKIKQKPARTYRDVHHHHIPIGYYTVRREAENISDLGDGLDWKEIDHLLHIIISHHGRVEWRSNVEPQTPEAFIVSQADMLDAWLAADPEKKATFGKAK